jgi:uncharacterized protein (TIGR02466 family)
MNIFSIERIFPTCYIKSNLNRDFTREEKDYFGSIEDYLKNTGNMISKDKAVLNDDKIAELKKFCMAGINFYVDKIIRPSNKMDFYMTQSWFNFTKPGDFHHAHTHANSILSGVFYTKATEGEDTIVFTSPILNNILNMESTDFVYENARTWIVPVKTGDLIIFPSTLEHRVEMTKGTDVRISIAFNTFAKGIFGNPDNATELVLT